MEGYPASDLSERSKLEMLSRNFGKFYIFTVGIGIVLNHTLAVSEHELHINVEFHKSEDA